MPEIMNSANIRIINYNNNNDNNKIQITPDSLLSELMQITSIILLVFYCTAWL